MIVLFQQAAVALLLVLASSTGATQSVSSTAHTASSEALLRRVLGPAHTAQFVVDATAPSGTMAIGSQAGKVLLRGSNGVEVASALSWYLNEYCNTTFDWSNYEILLPDAGAPLPLPQAASRARYTNYTYYLNVCTFGYSLVWKDWSYWQKHIDWMAMQGINLPLALAGQEKVIVNTFSRFNVTAEELSENYFAGPAFLPWGRMGNLQKWGGPLPLSWIDQQATLQVKLLARMRELGMRPVLSAFAGFVPPAFIAKHPYANITKVSEWGQYNRINGTGFYGDYQQTLLEPTDPLFQAIGKAWIEEQIKIYGTDHIYQCDTYNEMRPRSNDLGYLAASAKAVSDSMRTADPDAVWLMQDWAFSDRSFWGQAQLNAYMGAIPLTSLFMLMVSGEWFSASERNYYEGHPYIWDFLHTFGGQTQMDGDLGDLACRLGQSLHNSLPIRTGHANCTIDVGETCSTNLLTGVGLTWEGIWIDYIMAEYVLGANWVDVKSKQHQSAGLTLNDPCSKQCNPNGANAPNNFTATCNSEVETWIEKFGRRRYGSVTGQQEQARELWKRLPAYHSSTESVSIGARGEGVAKSGLFANRPTLCLAPCSAGAGALGQPKNPPVNCQFSGSSPSLCGCSCPAGIDWKNVSTGNRNVLEDFRASWKHMIALGNSSATMAKGKTYQFDLVDVTRQVLTDHFNETLYKLSAVVASTPINRVQLSVIATELLATIDDLDWILGTHQSFMLGTWINEARSWGTTSAESDHYEWSARNQVTLWGPSGRQGTVDYAAKAWSGLAKTYYKPRWALYLQMLQASESGEVNQTAFNDAVLTQVEQPWQHMTAETQAFPSTPSEAPLTVAIQLFKKYGRGEAAAAVGS